MIISDKTEIIFKNIRYFKLLPPEAVPVILTGSLRIHWQAEVNPNKYKEFTGAYPMYPLQFYSWREKELLLWVDLRTLYVPGQKTL